MKHFSILLGLITLAITTCAYGYTYNRSSDQNTVIVRVQKGDGLIELSRFLEPTEGIAYLHKPWEYIRFDNRGTLEFMDPVVTGDSVKLSPKWLGTWISGWGDEVNRPAGFDWNISMLMRLRAESVEVQTPTPTSTPIPTRTPTLTPTPIPTQTPTPTPVPFFRSVGYEDEMFPGYLIKGFYVSSAFLRALALLTCLVFLYIIRNQVGMALLLGIALVVQITMEFWQQVRDRWNGTRKDRIRRWNLSKGWVRTQLRKVPRRRSQHEIQEAMSQTARKLREGGAKRVVLDGNGRIKEVEY